MQIIDNDSIIEGAASVTFTEKTDSYIAYFRLSKEAMDVLGKPIAINYGVDGNKVYFLPDIKGIVKVYTKSNQVSATKLLKVVNRDIFPQVYVMQKDVNGYYVEVDFM